jgi:hypothetical protein
VHLLVIHKHKTDNNFENNGIISKACLKYGIVFWGGDSEIKTAFRVQKRVIWIVSGTNKCKSCRKIFKDYRILIVTSYIFFRCYVT